MTSWMIIYLVFTKSVAVHPLQQARNHALNLLVAQFFLQGSHKVLHIVQVLQIHDYFVLLARVDILVGLHQHRQCPDDLVDGR